MVNFTFERVSIATIEIMDIHGKLITTKPDIKSGDALSVEDLENGIYMPLVRTDKGNYLQGLIKQ